MALLSWDGVILLGTNGELEGCEDECCGEIIVGCECCTVTPETLAATIAGVTNAGCSHCADVNGTWIIPRETIVFPGNNCAYEIEIESDTDCGHFNFGLTFSCAIGRQINCHFGTSNSYLTGASASIGFTDCDDLSGVAIVVTAMGGGCNWSAATLTVSA
jgi:hypothetical protein